MIHKKIRKKKKYDYDILALKNKKLLPYVFMGDNGVSVIDFKDQKAKIELNKAIIKQELAVDFWEIPDENLCPVYDSRLDYIEFIYNTIASLKLDNDQSVKGIDIGCGASVIYPLIGVKKYNWAFIATDIDTESLKNAQLIIEKNKLQGKIQLVLQKQGDPFFQMIQDE